MNQALTNPSILNLLRQAQKVSDLYCEAGGFADAPLSTARQRDLRRQARQWLDQVRPLLETLSNPTPQKIRTVDNDDNADNDENSAALSAALRAYDMMHRVAHGAPDPDYVRRIRLNLVQRWARGDRSLSQTEIALMIADEIDRDISTLPARYITFYLDLQSRWIRELAAHGTFPGLPAEETYLRLARLLLSLIHI